MIWCRSVSISSYITYTSSNDAGARARRFSTERSFSLVFAPFVFDFENETLSENRVRDLVYEELVGFHDEIRSAEAAARAEAS